MDARVSFWLGSLVAVGTFAFVAFFAATRRHRNRMEMCMAFYTTLFAIPGVFLVASGFRGDKAPPVVKSICITCFFFTVTMLTMLGVYIRAARRPTRRNAAIRLVPRPAMRLRA